MTRLPETEPSPTFGNMNETNAQRIAKMQHMKKKYKIQNVKKDAGLVQLTARMTAIAVPCPHNRSTNCPSMLHAAINRHPHLGAALLAPP